MKILALYIFSVGMYYACRYLWRHWPRREDFPIPKHPERVCDLNSAWWAQHNAEANNW